MDGRAVGIAGCFFMTSMTSMGSSMAASGTRMYCYVLVQCKGFDLMWIPAKVVKELRGCSEKRVKWEEEEEEEAELWLSGFTFGFLP